MSIDTFYDIAALIVYATPAFMVVQTIIDNINDAKKDKRI